MKNYTVCGDVKHMDGSIFLFGTGRIKADTAIEAIKKLSRKLQAKGESLTAITHIESGPFIRKIRRIR